MGHLYPVFNNYGDNYGTYFMGDALTEEEIRVLGTNDIRMRMDGLKLMIEKCETEYNVFAFELLRRNLKVDTVEV